MPQPVVAGAQLTCSFGTLPATLIVRPTARVLFEERPIATVMDSVPLMNIPSFGLCNAPSNPAVLAATAAAMGTLTPAPCIPATAEPWVPGAPTVLVGGLPALNHCSVCACMWAGTVSVAAPGTVRTRVP